MSENAIVNVFEDGGLIADLTSSSNSYCSFKGDTPEKKAQLFEAMTNPDKRLRDCVGETILVTDIYCEVVNCTNEETGEVTQAPRIVLIDKDGVSYTCVSLGILSALKRLMSIYGKPTWGDGIPLKVTLVNRGTKSMLSFKIDVKKK